MKKILLTTYGSHGDLHPYLTMGSLLVKAGYKVTIATILLYKENVEAIGCEFVVLRPNIDEIGPEEEWTKKANDSFKGAEYIARELIIPYSEENYNTLLQATENCDLIISHVLTFFSPVVAEKRGIPWLTVMLQPATIMSAYDPPAFSFALNLPEYKFLGPAFFKILFNVFAKFSYNWFKPIYELRKKEGLKNAYANPLMKYFSPYGTLVLFPRSFAAPQEDWPANSYQLGFPLYSDPESTLSDNVTDFLDKGDEPLVFTLGSAVVQMKSDFFKIAFKAVKQTGVRAVFLTGDNKDHITDEMSADEQVCISGYESYPLLFPKCKAIVHQCGIGTTSQALYSGKPQIMIPFAHDQPDNARIIKNLGCGEIVFAKKLSVEKLVKAINEVTGNKQYQINAEKYREELLENDFEMNFLEAVEKIL
ncbi:MAG: glycosyltransferase family 1 protein [Ignavibacteriae bacterium]|nr:glycosyltransferase family 1 protein [Ignavibacteriota bacterium]